MANSKWMRRVKHMHFIGIGGSGMSGLVEVFFNEGYQVSGSDIADGPVVERLGELGITIFIGHEAKNIEAVDVIVVSSAIDENNVEIKAAREKRIPIVPRAEMLAELMRFRRGIAIAGTHGKTTTTSLIASILAKAGLDPTYVIGGRLNSSGSHAKLGEGHYLVAEADESDASFLHLQPMMAVVTNIDFDHMPTYDGDANKLYDTFVEFLYQLPFYGLAIVCRDDVGVQKVLDRITCPILTYGLEAGADVQACNVEQHGTQMTFTVQRWGKHADLNITLNLPGKHNVLNALSAIIVATELGVEDEAICSALAEFAGVGRRFQQLGAVKFQHGEALLIDDYGHHPREVAATMAAIHGAWPDKRLVMVYQPHRYTRTHDLFDDFVEVLAGVDQLILLDIYSAGEEPIADISSEKLCKEIVKHAKNPPIHLADKEQLLTTLNDIVDEGDVLLLQGAGDIGKLVKHIYEKTKAI